MSTDELLKKINRVCFEAKKNKLDLNLANDFPSGCIQGASVLAQQIIELLQEYSKPDDMQELAAKRRNDEYEDNLRKEGIKCTLT